MQNIKTSKVVKGLFIVAILSIGIFSFLYIDFFSNLKSALLFEQPTEAPVQNVDYAEMETKKKEMEEKLKSGEIDKKDVTMPEGIEKPSIVEGSKNVLAFTGISAFVILIVYYLDIYFNNRNRKRKTIQKAS